MRLADDSPRTEETTSKKYLFNRLVLLLLGGAAVGLAFFAQQLAGAARGQSRPAPPWTSWSLFALSAALFTIAVWPAPKLYAALPAAAPRDIWRRMLRKRPFVFLIGAALFCTVAEIPLFLRLNAAEVGDTADDWLINTGSWLLYLVSLVAWLAAFLWWDRTASDSPARESEPIDGAMPERLSRRVEWVVLAALFGFALLLRLINLEGAPPGFWFDEAQNGMVARNLLGAGAPRPVFIGDYTLMGSFYFYLLGAVLKAFGSSIWAVRLLPALSGAVIVVLLYGLAARLYGWRVGVAAAFLLSVSAWHLTFSRLGLVTMFTVALDVAIYFCLERAVRTGRLVFFAAGGLLLGVALHGYYIARLVPVVIVALLLHRAIGEGRRLLRALQSGAIVFACGVVIGVAPLLLFVGQKPEVYNQRLKDASIFSAEGGGGDPTPVRTNLIKHLLMFNYQGDWNGRHNIPDEPQLDPLMAALFFAGLGSCVLRARRWQYFFPLVWFAAALAGGVLSLLFEAPQAHRTVENSVVTALVVGIVLGELWALWQYAATGPEVRRAAHRLAPYLRDAHYVPPMLVGFTIAALLCFVAALNLHRYFGAQIENQSVWVGMGVPETAVARTLQKFVGAAPAEQPEIYVSDKYHELNLSAFLAPGVTHREWEGFDLLPLETPADRRAILLLEPKSAADLALIARLYPHAVFEVLRAPHDAEPLLYRITVPAEDIRALHGVRASDESGTEAGEVLPRYEYELKTSTRAPSSIRLASTIKVDDFGDYEFRLERPPGVTDARVAVNGGPIEEGRKINLARGLHSVTVTAQLGNVADEGQTATKTLRLLWKSAGVDSFAPLDPHRLYDARRVGPRGLTGLYREGKDVAGAPRLQRTDPIVAFLYHRTPLARPYNVEWTGRLYIPRDGIYSFGTQQRSRSRLFINGTEVIDNQHAEELKEARLKLTAGFHDLRLLFADEESYSQVFLYWTPPGRKRSIIPSAFLWPAPELTGEAAAGRPDLPTVEESDGSAIPANRSQPLKLGAD